jgi:MFS superfamily sulfate permease-like transporter
MASKPAQDVVLGCIPRWAVPTVGDLSAGMLLALLNVFYSVSFSALLFSRGMSDYTPTATTMLLMSGATAGAVTAVASTFTLSSAGPDPIIVSVLFTSSAVVSAYVADPSEAFVTLMALIMLSSFAAAAVCIALASMRLGHFVYAIPGPVTAGFLAGCGCILLDESLAIMGGGSLRRTLRAFAAKIGFLAADLSASESLEGGTQAMAVLTVGLAIGLALMLTSIFTPRYMSMIMPCLLVGAAVLVHVALASSGNGVNPFGRQKGDQPWAVGAGWLLEAPERVETDDVPGPGVLESLRGAWAWLTGDIGRVAWSTLLRETPQTLIVVPLVTTVTVLLRAVGLDVWESQEQARLAREKEKKEATSAADKKDVEEEDPEGKPLLAGEKKAFSVRGITRFDSELRAAGFSCLASAVVGGPPAFVEYAATMLNAAAGATTRMASIVTALVCFAVALSGLTVLMIRVVPVPVLGGVIAYLGMHLLWEWGWRYTLAGGGGATGDVFVVLVTLLGVLVLGFIPGLVGGAGLTLMQHCLCSAERASIHRAYSLEGEERGTEVVVLVGQLDFGAAAALVWRVQERLERVRRPVGQGAAELCMPGRWEPIEAAKAGLEGSESRVSESVDAAADGSKDDSRSKCQWPWPSGGEASSDLAGDSDPGKGGLSPLQWLILDMRGVTGLDRSAAAAILKLCDVMAAEGVRVPQAIPPQPSPADQTIRKRLGAPDEEEGDDDAKAPAQQHLPPSTTTTTTTTTTLSPPIKAHRSRVVVVGLSPALQQFLQASAGQTSGESSSLAEHEPAHLSSSAIESQGLLPRFVRDMEEAKHWIASVDGAAAAGRALPASSP